MSLIVRPAVAADLAVVAEFNRQLARETEGKELDPAVVLRAVGRGLADPARALYRVAEEGGEVVGQLMVTPEWSDWRDGWFWWVQSVYVRADRRRRGVFAALWADIMSEAAARPDVVGVRLYVERDNASAQAVYERLGLRFAGYLIMEAAVERGGP